MSTSSLSNLPSPSSRCHSQRYSRIPMITKRKLLKKVFQDGISIKEAALQIRINYSTAKTILFLYRRKHKFLQEVKQEADTPTDFTDSNDGPKLTAGLRSGPQRLSICCSIGGVASPDSPSQCSLRERTQFLFELWFSLTISQSHFKLVGRGWIRV